MRCRRSIVWQDEVGTVRLAYNVADYLALVVDADAATTRAVTEGSGRLAAADTGAKRPSFARLSPTGGDYLTTSWSGCGALWRNWGIGQALLSRSWDRSAMSYRSPRKQILKPQGE
ncbi:MAG: hypothetical protein ACRDSZ_02120 [Pseudonocardiaceae bacterium]